MWTHTWVNPIVFGNNQPNRTTVAGENAAPKPVFLLLFSRYGVFWRKNLKTVFDTPFPTKKVVFIFVIHSPFLSKTVTKKKLFFAIILENITISKKIVKWKIFKTSFSTKKVILNFVARRNLLLKTVMSSRWWFFTVFFKKYCFFRKAY